MTRDIPPTSRETIDIVRARRGIPGHRGIRAVEITDSLKQTQFTLGGGLSVLMNWENYRQ